ncbi:ribonuclease P protein component [Pleurocapsa sp. CCALA 161]|uniref:ribonuclease P protein component n=1 Tax=Pleurocapsa sp. CCALA 161 TaxID=2107688 RepID=UPI000D073AAB|nr:ribonuclease P protein component [Pleurocapsa sp. CCALA 161]PSB06618.1 ribonuclease P protein component [Pleurocapsa sp. CCALA 161]
MGLPKSHRLRDRGDYRAVYAQGIRRYSPHLTLFALAYRETKSTDSTPASSFGISISKKVSKKAVVRNRIKRQIKGVIRSHLQEIKAGWQIVIVVRPKAIECKYEHFLRELEELLKQAKIINGY